MRIQGPRILLRQWREEDFEPFARLSTNAAVMEHLLPLPNRAAMDALAKALGDHIARHGFGFWVVELPGAADFIGFTGLIHTTFESHFTPAIEIGWRLDPAYWGQGYATEAANVALGYGFRELRLTEIVSLTARGNRRSRSVMERLGMSRDESDDFDHPRVPEGHPLRRHVLYRLRRSDWRAPLFLD